MSFACPPSQAAPRPPNGGRRLPGSVREMSSGTGRRTGALPLKGRHDGAVATTENVERSADSLAYHAGEQ